MTYTSPDGMVTLIQGDCVSVLQGMEAESVDAIVTDPPYNVQGKDIELEGRSPMRRDFGSWDYDWNPSCGLVQWSRVLRVGGSVLSFTSDRLISKFREGPLKPRGTLVWIKDNPAPHPRPAYVQATEFIIWLQKEGAAACWNGNGYTLNTFFCAAPAGEERLGHPTQKPLKLLKELITNHTNRGDLILDPFMGVGSTIVAAYHLGRRAIGIEINPEYVEIAKRRLGQMVMQL